jgi:hypothetical protein
MKSLALIFFNESPYQLACAIINTESDLTPLRYVIADLNRPDFSGDLVT